MRHHKASSTSILNRLNSQHIQAESFLRQFTRATQYRGGLLTLAVFRMILFPRTELVLEHPPFPFKGPMAALLPSKANTSSCCKVKEISEIHIPLILPPLARPGRFH